jgi:WD40 repeat protein
LDGASAAALVLDIRFLRTKLVAHDARALLGDLDLALNANRGNVPLEGLLALVRDALALSLRHVARDPGQLVTQLFGRLRYEEPRVVDDALRAFASRATAPWWQLCSPGLTLPGPLVWEGVCDGSEGKVGLTPDGMRILLTRADGCPTLYSSLSALPVLTLVGEPRSGAVLAAAVTGVGGRLRVFRTDGSLDEWDLTAAALVARSQLNIASIDGDVCAAALDGDFVLFGTSAGTVGIWRCGDAEYRAKPVRAKGANVMRVALSVASCSAVALLGDGRLERWRLDLDKAALLEPGQDMGSLPSSDWRSWDSAPALPVAIALTNDGARLFAAGEKKVSSNARNALSITNFRGDLLQYSIPGCERLAALEVDERSSVVDFALSTNDHYGVTLSRNGTLRLWDLRRAGKQRELAQHAESSPFVAVTGDGRLALSIADDGVLSVYELLTGAVHRSQGQRDPVLNLLVSRSGRYAIVVSLGYCVVWNLESLAQGPILGEIPQGDVPDVWLRLVKPLPEGEHLLTVDSGGGVKLWELETGRSLSEQTLSRSVRDAAVSPDAHWLLYIPYPPGVSDPKELVLYDLTGTQPERAHFFDEAIDGIHEAFSDGQATFRIELEKGQSWLWDPNQPGPEATANRPESRRLRVTTPDRRHGIQWVGARVSLIQLPSNSEVASYTADAPIYSGALSADARVLVLADVAKRVHVLRLVVPS